MMQEIDIARQGKALLAKSTVLMHTDVSSQGLLLAA